MSARNRGRGSSNQDADEERRLWKEIKDKAREVDVMVARSNAIGNELIEVEAQQATLLAANKPSAELDDRLEKLYRENVKLTEEVQHILDGKSNEMNLLDSINILAGLREASEESAAQQAIAQSTSRAAAASSRSRPKKVSTAKSASATTAASVADDHDEAASAAPSPRLNLTSAANRLNVKAQSSRAGSVATTRETSVKIEDGAESVASSTDAPSTSTTTTASGLPKPPRTEWSSTSGRPTNRLVLSKGEIVFCRHPTHPTNKPATESTEGEGILCRVTAVIGEGKQRRYEVQDADPSGSPPPPQRASVSQLIQIPVVNKGLSDLGKGRSVLAQYPDTTTFYKAEVSEAWSAKANAGGGVKLNFQDDEVAREVERRFVLTEK